MLFERFDIKYCENLESLGLQKFVFLGKPTAVGYDYERFYKEAYFQQLNID